MGIESISDSIVSFIRPIIPQLIASIIGIIGILLTNRLKNADKDKIKNRWRSFLRIHKVVDKCLSDYNKARYPPPNELMFFSTVISFSLGMISGLLLIIFVGSILSRYVPDIYKLLFYIFSIISLLSFIVLIIIARHTDYLVKKDELLGSYRKIDFLTNFVFWFVSAGDLFIILIYFILTFTIPVKNYVDLFSIFIIYIFSIFVVIYLRIETLNNLKRELTRKYAKKFPRVLITTNVGEISGRIYNIFNEDVLLLDDDGCKVAVEWNHIILLRIIDGNTYNV